MSVPVPRRDAMQANVLINTTVVTAACLLITTKLIVILYINNLKIMEETINSNNIFFSRHAVAKMVEALRYKPEGCGFDSRWCHWNFSLT
jgi:hypothetical protein